jgi:type I restriction enzyme S subunit
MLDAEFQEMPRVPDSLLGNADFLEVGDVVFVDASEDVDGVGKAVEIRSVPADGLVAGLHTIAVRWDTSVMTHGFRAYLPFNPWFRQGVLRLAAGTKVLATQKTHIAGLVVALPPLPEQQAIAEVLSDTDALIESLEDLLAKKQLVKQATMDDLLTGRRRLAGFDTGAGFQQTEVGEIPEDWKVGSLGTLASLTMGRTPARKNPAYWGSGQPWLTIADLHGKFVGASKEQITELAASQMEPVPPGTLIMSFKLSIGRVAITTRPLFTNEAICHVRDPIPDRDYLFYALQRTDFELYGKQAVKGYTLNSESLNNIQVVLPPLPEQQAIAKVLSDMDEDIEALQRRLDKTKRVKEALMDELLSGRTRV